MSDSLDFAKLYGAGRDQVVVIRRAADVTEEGEAVLTVYYDPQVDGLNISSINLGFATTEARDDAWATATEEKVLEFIGNARRQLQEALAGRTIGHDSGLLDAQGEPLYSEAADVPREE